MNRSAILAEKLSENYSPYVGRLAERLVNSSQKNNDIINEGSWGLIEEIFGFAIEAERQLIEQEDKITLLEGLSSTDDLTGLANRRGLLEFLDGSIARARRHGRRGIVGYFDLDWFKDINDTLGHQAGDEVLKHVGDVLSQNIRRCDLAARPGGDEFIVVLDGAELDLGTERLKFIQNIINTVPFNNKGLPVDLNISLGFSYFSASSDPLKILEEADQAMYSQKGEPLKKTAH
ncbi:MAG: GGDEF domain-containing protein [Sphingomonadales bacterium]|nr:GGDEF domain-containing protein [Sphingomonadales bacterium]